MANPRPGVEENTLAILDSYGVRDAGDALYDKLSFLQAVRAASLDAAPTWNMHDAVFHLLVDDDSSSLEILIACHSLLTDLHLRYPRIRLDGSRGVVVTLDDAWVPFALTEDGPAKTRRHLVDPASFSLLIQGIAGSVSGIELVRRMALLQYLCHVLEGDFSPRQASFVETRNWPLVRESLLSMILVSRRLNFKGFVRGCFSVVTGGCRTNGRDGGDAAIAFALQEFEKKTCVAVQKLLALIMELDSLRKEADMLHLTSRADPVRTPALELLVDELTYDRDRTFPFLLAFTESKWKLEIILQYVWKYCSNPAVRTRKSSRSEDDASLEGLFAFLSNAANLKNVAKRIAAEEVQLLLSHAFEAHLSVNLVRGDAGGEEWRSLRKICNDFIAVFNRLMEFDKDYVPSSVEKEALFMAAAILTCH